MNALWSSWVRFWSEREHPAPWAAFRIAMALVVLQTFFSIWWHDALPLYMSADAGGFAPPGKSPWWSESFGGATLSVTSAVIWTAMGLAVALLVGVGGRVTALALGQVCMMAFAMHPGTGGGHDRLITNGLWLLVLTSGTATWSLDAKIRTQSWTDHTRISCLGRRLAVFQLVIMYTWTGVQKQGVGWSARGDYRALYDAFLLPTWARWDMTWVSEVFMLTQIGTVVAWWWELLWVVLGLALLARHAAFAHTWWGRLALRWDVRVPFVFLGIITHGILWVVMNLGPFSPVTFTFYLALIRHDDVAHWFPSWVKTDGAGSLPSNGRLE